MRISLRITAAMAALAVSAVLMGLLAGVFEEKISPNRLAPQSVPADGLSRLVQSLESAAVAHSGQRDTLPIALDDDAPASLVWALKPFEFVQGERAYGIEAPPVILAREDAASANLPADYIGQSLGILETRGWDTVLPPDLILWWIDRDVPAAIESWILWVRADIASFGEIGLEAEEIQ